MEHPIAQAVAGAGQLPTAFTRFATIGMPVFRR
jgi:hypothetical protein